MAEATWRPRTHPVLSAFLLQYLMRTLLMRTILSRTQGKQSARMHLHLFCVVG